MNSTARPHASEARDRTGNNNAIYSGLSTESECNLLVPDSPVTKIFVAIYCMALASARASSACTFNSSACTLVVRAHKRCRSNCDPILGIYDSNAPALAK